MSAKTHRHRYVRTFLALAVAAASAGCSSYSGPSEYEQQMTAKEEFVNSIVKLGGSAEEKEYPGIDQTAWVINLSGATISEETLDALIERVEREYVSEVDFSGSTLTDEQFVQLDAGGVGNTLIKLNLSNTGVTDQGLDQINNMMAMMELNLSGTGVTREAADRFKARMTEKREAEATPGQLRMLGDMKIEL